MKSAEVAHFPAYQDLHPKLMPTVWAVRFLTMNPIRESRQREREGCLRTEILMQDK